MRYVTELVTQVARMSKIFSKSKCHWSVPGPSKSSLCFGKVQIIEVLRSTTRAPWSCFLIISLCNAVHITRFCPPHSLFFGHVIGKTKFCRITESPNASTTLLLPPCEPLRVSEWDRNEVQTQAAKSRACEVCALNRFLLLFGFHSTSFPSLARSSACVWRALNLNVWSSLLQDLSVNRVAKRKEQKH